MCLNVFNRSLGSPGAIQIAAVRRHQDMSSKRSDRIIYYSSPDPWGNNRSI